MEANFRSRILWLSVCVLLLSIVLFVIPSSSGEVGVNFGSFLGNGSESLSLILLGAGLIGIALRGLRKTGK